jgi:hypothetical protein
VAHGAAQSFFKEVPIIFLNIYKYNYKSQLVHARGGWWVAGGAINQKPKPGWISL